MEVVFIVVAFVIVFSLGYSYFRTRKDHVLVTTAKQNIRSKVLSFDDHDLDVILDDCQIDAGHRSSGKRLLAILSKVLDVPVSKISADQNLYDMLSYRSQGELNSASSSIEPYTYELVDLVSLASDKDLWHRRWNTNQELPRNEDSLSDFIMAMNVREFVQFFAPLIKEKWK